MNKSGFTPKRMAFTGLMAALVFVASTLGSIPIPTEIGTTRIHLGNIFCLLSGMLLGPFAGGLAAGIGSMLFDVVNPLFTAEAPFTFAFKFIMAWVCGMISRRDSSLSFRRALAACVCGALSYIVLYLGKNFVYDRFFLRVELQTALISLLQKGQASLINGLLAVVFAVPLCFALRRGLSAAHIKL